MSHPSAIKITKARRDNPTRLESDVALAIYEVERGNKLLRSLMGRLFFNTVKQVDTADGKTALVILVPPAKIKAWRAVHKPLFSELEKKFSGKSIFLVAQRQLAPLRTRRAGVAPREQTRQAVNKLILKDLVYPAEVAGRRTRFKADGGVLERVLLDVRDKEKVEHKLAAIASIYKTVSHRQCQFAFMTNPALQQFI
eukprot:TRINITY_DN17306_c0_g1_i1.p2 TRINITY_DN17306_c0_g1~~TRINITY_DN17306_c0_g1_i1.p2  ORF type:complete len:197 (+),score=48.49 TRINITY_DN17306_c0_g1_i1:1042-1632(+)